MDPTYLCGPSFFKYTNMEILLILMDMDRMATDAVVSPSRFIAEMMCTMEERLEKLTSISRKEKIRRELSLNMLKALPDIVIFQNYCVGEPMTVPISILNTYEVSKPIRVVLEATTVFSLSCPSGIVNTKIAPGMAYQVNVTFFPHEQKDYRHYITIISEGESFVIPIICISLRPLLDIPDRIKLPSIPVKTLSERTIIVRNLGATAAVFNICCSEGYEASPSRACLKAQEFMQFTVRFMAKTAGNHRGRLIITYETGERLTVILEASTYESEVFLECYNIELIDTYMTLKRKKFLKLFNKSKHIVKYQWKKFRDEETDLLESRKFEERFRDIRNLEARRYVDLVQRGVIEGGDTQEVIYDRIYNDELREYKEGDILLYQDTNWSIYPPTGEVWPDNSSNFLITFSPSEARFYETTMYLEVSGKQERLVLKLCATGKGPLIELNLIELDANDIFLCSKHQYEVSIRNKGYIPGSIAYVPKTLTFGGNITCKPASNYLKPDRYASFVLTFMSNVQGRFCEELEFKIPESDEVHKIIFKGNIVCPLLNFDVTEIDFGRVTLGYPVTMHINLINTTQVPIEYEAQFLYDGENLAWSCREYALEKEKPIIQKPKELSFYPEKFTVQPNLTSKGELTLLPNVQGEYLKRLVIVMWGTPKYSISLPIQYKCEIPDVVCETQDIFMRGCFVNYVYTRTITIRSRNEHSGYFQFLPFDVDGLTEIMFESKPSEDFIEAHGSKEVELNIFTTHIGQSTLKVYISIFGGPEKLYLCTIRCNGQGPVITVPKVLYFEEIRTLKTATQLLKITNDSPVPATIAVTHNKRSCCSISHDQVVLQPTENLDISVNAYARAPGHYADRIVFTTEQGESQMCAVKVTAVGSSILCEPALEPEINLGTILTYQTFSLNVKFTNMGRKLHKIIWSRVKRLKSFKDSPNLYEGSVFSIKPNVFDLAPDQSIECILSGCGTNVGHLEEDFYCHAIIEGKTSHGIITSFLVIAEFARPMIELSHTRLHFRIDTGVDKTTSFLTDNLVVRNVSKLAITTVITVDEPFYMVQENGRVNSVEKHLEDGDVLNLKVEFVPKTEQLECVVWNKELVLSYVGHPHKDKIPVIGEENFPNLEISPFNIDFGCLPNFFSATIQLILKNVSPLPLTFQWQWIKDDIDIQGLDVEPIKWPASAPEDTLTISTISTPTFKSITAHEQNRMYEDCEEDGTYFFYRYEIDVEPPLTLPLETIEPKPTEVAVISTVERMSEHNSELQVVLYQLTKHHYVDSFEVEAIKCLPSSKYEECEMCCELVDLLPTYGYLGPYEAQMISLEFCPFPNSSIKALARCYPSGGKAEILTLEGKSANLSFSVESDVIEFGRQLFCEVCEQTIVIKNTGYAPLEIEAVYDQTPESELAGVLRKAGWFNVNLSKSGNDFEVRVKYFPGATREFTEKFGLQIAYLPPFSLTIHGHGVVEQIFCALPRPSLQDEMINYLSYLAIATITPDLLKDVKSLTQVEMKWKSDIPYNVRELMKSNEWVIVTFNELYPTVTDIQMAIERFMIDLYVSNNYSTLYDHTVLKNISLISNKLIAPPYIIDLGYVVRDTEVYYTASILNYGPDNVNIRVVWAKKTAARCGLRAKLANTYLQVGASTQLCISFSPTIKMFPTADNVVNETIYILVPHGQRVPIEITSHVAVPQVTLSEKFINFSEVILGNCLKKDVLLENMGHVTCNWEVKIEMDQKFHGKPVFSCKSTSGRLEAKEKILLDLRFEPWRHGKFKGTMTITINQNPENVTARLKGFGIKPMLKISEPELNFPSTLPYTPNVEATFTIENVSSVPIEFYFADFDEEIDTEELILNVLMDYYKTNRLYIPYRKAGEGLPSAIIQFYDSLLKILREKLSNTSPRSDVQSVGENEAEKLPIRKRSSLSSSKKNASNLLYNMKDPLASKTNEELFELLTEYLRSIKLSSFTTCKVSPVDPVADSINDALRHTYCKVSTDSNPGILIIFHGAPQTCFIRAATKVGRLVNLPVVNVDNLMFEALIRPSTLAAIKVRQILDEGFISVASESDLRNPPDFDEYDFLQKKIDILLSGKKRKPAKKPSAKESKKDKNAGSKKRSKQSSKKSSKQSSAKNKDKSARKKEKEGKKGKNDKKTKRTSSSVATETSQSTTKAKVDKRPTLLGISEELLYEILVSQLVLFNSGLIIQSLDSIFIRKPMMLLNWLLKNAGHLRYIHCVLFTFTYKDYIARKEAQKQKAEMKAIEDRKNRVEEILDMDCSAYANLSEEVLTIFREEILQPRKLETQRKHEALIQRLKDKETKTTKQKKGGRMSFASNGKRKSIEAPGAKPKKKEKKSKSDSSGKKSTKSKGSSKKSKTSSAKSKSSSKSSKKSRSSKGGKKEKKDKKKGRAPPEEQELKKLFTNSESLFWEILHTLEYWDRKSCTLTKPIPEQPLSRQLAKKSRSSKSSRSSKKSGEKKTPLPEETPPKLFSPEETERASYKGVPCWLVDSSHEMAECPIAERIVAYLQQTPELREAQEEIRNSSMPKFEESTILLSILQKPKKNREKNKSDIFNLNDVVVSPRRTTIVSDTDNLSIRSPKRRSSRRSSRMGTSVTSLDKMSLRSGKLSTTRSLTRAKDSASGVIANLTARTVIEPGEKNVYKTTFTPKRVGTYTHTFTIEVIGRYAKYFVKCQGVCEIPAFNWDPSLTFERVIQCKEHCNLFNYVGYLLGEKVFEFGTILLPNYKDATEKILKTTGYFHFTNESSQTCDTELYLTEDRVSKGVFDMAPDVFSVPPGETMNVNVCSKPFQPGNFAATMLVLVKNNPEVHTIDLSSAAMNIAISLEPNSIEFERTTLNCTVKKSAVLHNLSPVKIIWRAYDVDDLLTYFKVKPLSGRVNPHHSQRIDFKFTPKVTEDIPKKHLKIMVFDGNHESTMALRTDVITVSAEVINIDIECPRELNFGEVKGRVQHIYKFRILSKIKYNMDMIFTGIDTTRATKDTIAIKDLFKASPSHVSLKHDKVSTVDIIFFPKRFVDFTNVPIFHCIVSDPSTKNVVMDFDISASATAHSAKYKLCPTNEIYFGHLLIDSVQIEYISLENTGRFDFSYVIIPLKKALEKKRQSKKKKLGKKGQKGKKTRDKKGKSSTSISKSTSRKTKSSEKTSKTTKSTKSSKKKGKKGKKEKRSAEKKKKPKPTKLNVSCFTIISSTGILEPGETTTIEVTAKPKTVGPVEETILVFISECEPSDRKGIPFILSTKGVVPTYNFSNFKDIFFEQYVVNTMADFNCPEQLSMNPVYVKEENTLYLNKVCIGTVYETKIRVQSTNVVTTTLTASIDPNDIFSVQPKSVIVPSYNYGYFTISFNPQAIKTYECVLHLCNDNPKLNSENEFSVNISGEGYVPEINLIEPQPHPIDNSYTIAFTPLMIGKTEEKRVVLENTGLITCEVIAEICFDTFSMLKLLCDPDDHVNVVLNEKDREFRVEHTALMKIKPNCKVTLRVAFKPLQEISAESILKLYIVNNPFEVFMINLKCRSYLEDITINELPLASLEDETKFLESIRFSRYELDLGYCVLNTHKTKRFSIKNSSIVYTYRFEFTNYDKLIFSPCVGHLKPFTCKEILLSFITTTPINIIKETLKCSLSRIEYVNPDTEQLSWDDRQNIVIWQDVSDGSSSEKRISSAPTGSRRASRESYTKLRRPSTDNATSTKGSRSKLRESNKKSISSIRSSISDIKKSKTDGSITSMKERKIESRPEPLYTTLSDIVAPLEIVLSITADYCTYTCSVSEITLEDTLLFEKRSASFELTNKSTMPLSLSWCVNMDECFPRRINYDANTHGEEGQQHRVSEVLANIVKPTKRLVKSAYTRPIYLNGNEHFLSGNCTPAESAKSSTIFSENGSATNRSRDSWHETDHMPFTVEPYSYTIPPLSTKEFKLTFAPIDVFQYVVRLRSKIENLHPTDPGLEIIVQAKSLLPLYHFDIIPSDYLKHRQKLCDDLADENTKVVQFDAVGLNLVHTKSFTVINPTGESFSFRWDPAPIKNNDISLFRCNTPEGLVSKGKMAESSFSFVPQRLGKFETFYIFTIEKYDLKTTFLLTAVARNPCVFFSSNHVTLKPTLVNVEVTETVDLLNNEDMPLNFAFKRSSLLNNDHTKKIVVEPMEGTVLAKNRTAIKLIFVQSETGETDFRLKCHIERMQKPLILSVLSNVYDVESQLFYIHNNNKIVLDPKIIHTIELKSLLSHQEDASKFLIKNTGKIGFYFNWQCAEKYYKEYMNLNFKDTEGYCLSADETETIVKIKPLRALRQKRLKTYFQILYGPKYVINFMCTTSEVSYRFSFEEYDFGCCLVQPDNTTYYKCILEFINMEQQPLMLEHDSHNNDNFTISFKSKLIPTKDIEKIPIYFHPKVAGAQQAVFKFLINSKETDIILKGTGTPLEIELAEQEDKFINLGAVLAEKQVTKTVHVVNRSNAKVHIIFDLYERLPIHTRAKRTLAAEYEREEPVVEKKEKKKKKDKKGKKGKKGRKSSESSKKSSKKESRGSKKKSKSSTNESKSTKSTKSEKTKSTKTTTSKSTKTGKKTASTKSSKGSKKGKKGKKHKTLAVEEEPKETAKERADRLIQSSIQITPKKFITILPNEKALFTINYAPKEKMTTFTKKVFYQIQDVTEPLCLIKASCIAADYYLDRQKIALGNVAIFTTYSVKFNLFNTGDIGGKYKWKFEKSDPAISIHPAEGYISPDMSVTFTAKYSPKVVQCSINARAKCIIEHYNKPLRVELTGSCVKKPSATSIIKFSCPVRSETTQKVTITNSSSEPWNIMPKITGHYFTTEEMFHVPPLSNFTCEIKFSPTEMATKESPHKAVLSLVLGDGHCQTYNLEGVAEKPLVLKTIQRDIYCKTEFFEILEVENWLKTPQQFKVITENLKPHETKQILYKMTGNSEIDVPANGVRQYKWGIFVLNVGKLHFQVLFKNELTKEYLFYELKLNVQQGGALAEITLSTCVRMPVTHTLKLENPLKVPVTFQVNSNTEELIYEKTMTVEPLTERPLKINYIPLFPGERDANLEITTKELGVFLYHFHLEAKDVIPEATVTFKCPLGQNVKRKIPLRNISPTHSEFRAKLENKNIFSCVSDSIHLAPDENGFIHVIFEPNNLGNVESTLTLTSPTAGQFIYPLVGTCILPTPQGPILVKPGSTSTFNFKNPFEKATTFLLKMESECFQIKPILETVPARHNMKVIVGMMNVKCETIGDKMIPFTGKLTITYENCNIPNLKWVYYVQSEYRKPTATSI